MRSDVSVNRLFQVRNAVHPGHAEDEGLRGAGDGPDLRRTQQERVVRPEPRGRPRTSRSAAEGRGAGPPRRGHARLRRSRGPRDRRGGGARHGRRGDRLSAQQRGREVID